MLLTCTRAVASKGVNGRSSNGARTTGSELETPTTPGLPLPRALSTPTSCHGRDLPREGATAHRTTRVRAAPCGRPKCVVPTRPESAGHGHLLLTSSAGSTDVLRERTQRSVRSANARAGWLTATATQTSDGPVGCRGCSRRLNENAHGLRCAATPVRRSAGMPTKIPPASSAR